MNKNLKNLLVDCIIYLIFIVGIAFLYKSAFYSNLFAIVLLIITFSFFKDKEDFIFFIVGWILATTAEILSVHFKVWTYAYPHILGIPIWLSLGWAYSFLFLRRLRDSWYKLEHIKIHYTKHPNGLKNIIIYDILTYILALLCILILWKNNLLLTLILGLLLLAHTIKFHSKEDLFLVIAATITYTIIDMCITNVGVWTYSNTNFLTITTWLPFSYGIIAAIVRRISVSINLLMFNSQKNEPF